MTVTSAETLTKCVRLFPYDGLVRCRNGAVWHTRHVANSLPRYCL